MSEEVDLYDGYYGRLDADPLAAVRRQTWGEDFGQASWTTLAEVREFLAALQLSAGRAALEVACGSGGVTCRMAVETGATCTGVDLNPRGIEAAVKRARDHGLEGRVSFQVADASGPLPFADGSFDAILCNDSINHFHGRLAVLCGWHRLLRSRGRLLFTDPIVVTGQLTNDEIRGRSSIGTFVFTPVGCNERLLAEAGFAVRDVRDVTEPVATISKKWRDARAERRDAIVKLEGAEAFDGVQRFLEVVHLLAGERRLSRFLYVAEKPA